MGHVLAVVSQKGGVGKTTTAVNLAAAFAQRGVRTLLLDADPQGAVRYGVGLRPGHAAAGISDYLAGRASLRDVIVPTSLPWLRVILAGSVSGEADHVGYHHLMEETDLLPELLALARARTHVTIVDTPPGLGAIVRKVLAGSQHVVVPLQCEPLALQTTPQILRGIQDVASANPELTLDGIVITMMDPASETCCRVAEYVRQHLPKPMVLDVAIPRSAAASEAFAAGQPVVLRAPDDPAAAAYVRLATELAARFD